MESTLELETTAYVTGQLPKVDRPQIALAGRSNVGKSSLINALAGRKKLAKVSAQPGKTRSVNFYRVRPQDFYIVDLPGYGYARASHEERRQWAKTLEAYISGDTHIKALALLLDCRLPPQKLDKDLAAFAASKGLPVLPILTKADKCSQREREARRREWRDILGVAPIITSASHRQGIDKLWRALDAAALGQEKSGEPDAETAAHP
ncbi:ribosome biogenesis GTP-binding protein YihA/YsxC [Desulfovibrio sp.]|uniref:ribosome biogenesis GTP-binding protein YihA/YsxC n=1 Tax=Desulfovibrio sp. TaxID=885 RepID=UPI0023CEC7F0|nr:ribosome biogenesis GTP-binding protein YihA/YsxC [Desulfovibrio sp.]MDE7240437.1 ribosome biogenesis GTP-binding protein YihA/YsxC [Desulfovibrio sp.]